jgi:PDGLE domain
MRAGLRHLMPMGFVVAGLMAALALAFFVSPAASTKPDGLNKVAIEEGFAAQEDAHALDGSPTAGYDVKPVDDARLSTGIAGVIGVSVVFVAGAGLFAVVRRGRRAATVGSGL